MTSRLNLDIVCSESMILSSTLVLRWSCDTIWTSSPAGDSSGDLSTVCSTPPLYEMNATQRPLLTISHNSASPPVPITTRVSPSSKTNSSYNNRIMRSPDVAMTPNSAYNQRGKNRPFLPMI